MAQPYARLGLPVTGIYHVVPSGARQTSSWPSDRWHNHTPSPARPLMCDSTPPQRRASTELGSGARMVSECVSMTMNVKVIKPVINLRCADWLCHDGEWYELIGATDQLMAGKWTLGSGSTLGTSRRSTGSLRWRSPWPAGTSPGTDGRWQSVPDCVTGVNPVVHVSHQLDQPMQHACSYTGL